MNTTSPIGESLRSLSAMPRMATSRTATSLVAQSRTTASAQSTEAVSSNQESKADLVSALSVSETESLLVAQKSDPGLIGARKTEVSPEEEMTQRIRRAVDDLKSKATALEFEVDDKSGEIVVRVINPSSGEVIRQIPPEEMLKMSQRLNDMRGILFDKTT